MSWEDRREERFGDEPKDHSMKVGNEYIQIGDEFFKISELDGQPTAKANTRKENYEQRTSFSSN